jgi:hypothetical protein
MNPDLAYYIVRYYPNFMTDAEHRANRHLIGVLKATMGRDDAAAQQEAKKSKVFSRVLSDDPDVLELTRGGLQTFRSRTAARILADHGDEIFLNYCPRCHNLARTPQAQQCRSCGHDWHDAGLNHA